MLAEFLFEGLKYIFDDFLALKIFAVKCGTIQMGRICKRLFISLTALNIFLYIVVFSTFIDRFFFLT